MKYITVLMLLSFGSYANYAEFFGSSSITSALANQPSFNQDEASDIYYAPALLAQSKTLNISLSSSMVKTNLNAIGNVVTKSQATKGTTDSGDVDTDYGDTFMTASHFSVPLLKPSGLALAASLFTPGEKILDSHTGDSYAPEYVMYRARYTRSLLYAHLVYPLTPKIGVSIGALASFQTSASLNTRQSLNSTPDGASGSMRTQVRPALAAVTSIAYQEQAYKLFFSYQQEMKTEMVADVVGETADPSIPYDNTITSVIYYDPHILRLGGNYNLGKWSFFSTLEYQLWENYETPVIRIAKNSGSLKASDDYEKISAKNIFVPKVALGYKLTERFGLYTGLAIRPTPLEGEFNQSGNSVDTDSKIFSLGTSYKFPWNQTWASLSASFQLHKLADKTITKTDNQENGSSGDKVGSPGYTIGGDVKVVSFGANFTF